MFMIDFIPSAQMKKYLKEQKVVFSDFEKAALVWKMWGAYGWEEVRDSLQEIADATGDERTRQQILERIYYEEKTKKEAQKRAEEKALAAFKDDRGEGYVYLVVDDEDEENGRFEKIILGVFLTGNAAMQAAASYAKAQQKPVRVEKVLAEEHDEDYMRLFSKEDAAHAQKAGREENKEQAELEASWRGIERRDHWRAWGRSGPGLRREGTVTVNEEGAVFAEYDPSDTEPFKGSADERFEDRFVEIPHFFERGCVVKDLRSGSYGVVSVGLKEKRMLWKEKREKGEPFGYRDNLVAVMCLEKDGGWASRSFDPLELEAWAMPKSSSDPIEDSRARALKALSDYWTNGGTNTQEVLWCCWEYSENCRREEWFSHAKTAEELVYPFGNVNYGDLVL